MTTARAYRSARPATEAVGELWQHAGTDFDVPSLQGLASVVARMDAAALVALAEPPVEAADAAAAAYRRWFRDRPAVRAPRVLIARLRPGITTGC